MTRGKPGGLLVRFALPLILSSMLQQLYTLFDSVIVGRLLGETAFAAVGAAAFLNGIPLSILLGCTQGFGVAVITGMSASYRYFDLLNVVGYGMEGAVATFSAQNAGAKDYSRVRQGTRAGLLIGGGATLAINLVAIIFAEPMIGLFLRDGLTEAVQVGAASLRVRSAFVAAMYLLCAWRAAISGMGNAVIPMISGFLELGLKTAAILTLPRLLGLQGLYLMDAAAWVPVAAFLGLCYHRLLKQRLSALPQP